MTSRLFPVRRFFTTRSKFNRRQQSPRWRPMLEILEGRQLPSMTFTVTSTGDVGPNTLRQAILNANANPGADLINFNISGPGGHVIQPATPLPQITDAVTIDGTTQPGYAGTPLIQLDGTLAGTGANGLSITTSNCTILGLDITHFNADGIFVQAGNNNTFQSNFIGVDATGTKGEGNGGYGIELAQASKGNLIGTNGDGVNDTAERNLISGNGQSGVRIVGTGTNQNVVAGNYIGTNIGGTSRIGNGRDGVTIEFGAASNRIGTDGMSVDDAGQRNLIDGSRFAGVAIINTGSNQNVVAGNYIGTNVAGSSALPNGTHGVVIFAGAQSNLIGTNGTDKDLAGERNLLSGNTDEGVYISDAGTSSNVVAGNYIGTDVTGLVAVPNGFDGVGIDHSAQSNRIGTNADGVGDVAERNLISGNRRDGVAMVNGTSLNIVAGDYIGTDLSGAVALANGANGVEIWLGAHSNRIGTNGDGINEPAKRNIISGNLGTGVFVHDPGSNKNVVAGNYVGLNRTATGAVANTFSGIAITNGAQANQIGTSGKEIANGAERNIVSGNGNDGIFINGAGTNLNFVAGNFVGTDITGAAPLPNTHEGVIIFGGAQSNRIGTNGDGVNDALERNLISGNFGNGVVIADANTSKNTVAGNLIGTTVTGTAALPNGTRGGNGLQIRNGASFNTIGINGGDMDPVAERNILSGNIWSGVRLSDPGSDSNTVVGNYIGTDKTGTVALPNHGDGVRIETGAENNVIGASLLAPTPISAFVPNIIAFNEQAGIKVLDELTNGNTYRANPIFSNGALGIDLNGDGVTPNAPGVRGEANDTQNYPVLTKAVSTTSSTQVTGTLNSLVSQPFTIDFYANPTADPSGFGQGRRYLGSTIVMTDASGNATISVTLPVGGVLGQAISATTTASSGDTSEFAKDVTATSMSARTVALLPAGANAAGAEATAVAVTNIPGHASTSSSDVGAPSTEAQPLPKPSVFFLPAFHRRGPHSEDVAGL
jgi:titin